MGTTRNSSAASASGWHGGPEPLLRCMGSKSDFPALSNIIVEINKIVASETESAGKLAQTILNDFALTNKLLKLVNTVAYSQFGGKINTISKAVVITGFETVRNIAMTLTLLEFLQNKNQAAELKDEIIFALLAGEVAAQLPSAPQHEFAEELRITSMFHSLGKLLVSFYCFEDSQKITRLSQEQGLGDEQGALKVLGISYNDLGISVLKSWNFPARMIAEIRKLPKGKIKKAYGSVDRLCIVANLANELVETASIIPAQHKEDSMRQLCARYDDVMPDISAQILADALKNGVVALSNKSRIVEIDTSESPLLKKICEFIEYVWPIEQATKVFVALNETGKSAPLLEDIQTITITDEEVGQRRPEDMLIAGIQDVTNTLMGEYNLNDVLYMVLETVHRSLGFDRTLIFLRDAKQTQMAARFGLGSGVDAVIPYCRFPLAFGPDVFHLAIEQEKDILIENTHAGNIIGKIPDWYRGSLNAQGLLLMPIVANGQAIGLLYTDVLEKRSLQITRQQLTMLHTLRNQLVLAFKQRI